MAALAGRTIGNYLVHKEVGRGGMGAVYLAEHPRLKRRVAVKVLHPDMSRDAEMVVRFFNEARAASDIRNAHIVDILDFGELPDGTPYLIMEWLEGRSLGEVLKADRRMALPRAAHIAGGVGRALAAAHAHGVVHRDLKPDNIFLVRRDDDADFVKVLDFGIAKLLVTGDGPAPRTATNVVLGTPAYMSPEQCRGESSTLDGRSDVYSLGVILYEMATGRRPFNAETYTGILVAHVTQQPPPPRAHEPSIPAAAERVILHALEKEREKRYARVEDLVNEFAAAIGVPGITAPGAVPAALAPSAAADAGRATPSSLGRSATLMAFAGPRETTPPPGASPVRCAVAIGLQSVAVAAASFDPHPITARCGPGDRHRRRQHRRGAPRSRDPARPPHGVRRWRPGGAAAHRVPGAAPRGSVARGRSAHRIRGGGPGRCGNAATSATPRPARRHRRLSWSRRGHQPPRARPRRPLQLRPRLPLWRPLRLPPRLPLRLPSRLPLRRRLRRAMPHRLGRHPLAASRTCHRARAPRARAAPRPSPRHRRHHRLLRARPSQCHDPPIPRRRVAPSTTDLPTTSTGASPPRSRAWSPRARSATARSSAAPARRARARHATWSSRRVTATCSSPSVPSRWAASTRTCGIPRASRIATDKPDRTTSSFRVCAEMTGQYHFEGKPARGAGSFRTAIYVTR